MNWTDKAIDYTHRVTAVEARIKQETADATAAGRGKVWLRRRLAPLRVLRAGLIAKAIRADQISARPSHVGTA